MEESSRPRSKFMSGAALIAVGSIVAKLLGALYRVPLTNILGAEGMGMYQLVFPVFALFMVLSTAGIPTALSRVVAEKRALGEPVKKYLVATLFAVLVLGTVSAAILAGLANRLAVWQGNGRTALGYYIMAPTVILVSVIAAFRGWFQGELNMFPTAMSNIIEQSVKLIAGVALALALRSRGALAAVLGALLGVTASEACALIYLVVTYLVKGRREEKEPLLLNRLEARDMLKAALPIAIVALLMPLSGFLDSVILVNALKFGGTEQGAATALYGLYSGPVNSLVNMPIVVIMSLAVVIVPSVSVSRVTRDIDGVLLKSRLSIKLAYLIGIPCAAFFIVFAPRLLPLIYPALSDSQLRVTVDLLRIAASNIVFLAAMQIYVSLLQALDKTKYAVISLASAIAVKAALSFFVTAKIGILGGAIAAVAMSVIAFVGVNAAYRKICGIHLEKNVFLNLLLGVIMALVGVAVSSLIKNNILATALGFIACATAYVWLALLFGLVGREELKYMPLSKLFLKLHRIVRFWEYRDET